MVVIVGEALLLAGAPTIAGSVAGGIVFYHGIDQIQKGVKQLLTNREQKSVTMLVLEKCSVREDIAEFADEWVGVVGGLAGAKLLIKGGSLGEEVVEKVVKDVASKEPERSSPKLIRKEVYPSEGVSEKAAAGESTSLVDLVSNEPNPILKHPRTGSALKVDPYHSFSDIIDNYGGQAKSFELPTKDYTGKVVRISELRQIEGSLNGKNGVFEWIIDKNEVTHRRFIPNGKITGYPNQKTQKN